jgi:hypothetical protein
MKCGRAVAVSPTAWAWDDVRAESKLHLMKEFFEVKEGRQAKSW